MWFHVCFEWTKIFLQDTQSEFFPFVIDGQIVGYMHHGWGFCIFMDDQIFSYVWSKPLIYTHFVNIISCAVAIYNG